MPRRLVALACAALLLGAALALDAAWLARERAPFHAVLAGSSEGWSVKVDALRDGRGRLAASVLLRRDSGLPRAFFWELALPGQGVTCRGVATVPAGAVQAGLPPCAGRWLDGPGAFRRAAGAGWVGIVWASGGPMREIRLPLAPAPGGESP